MFKSLDDKNIYESTKLSFNFDFFSPLNRKEAASKLAKALGVKIMWSNKLSKAYESNNSGFKLVPTYSKGYKELSFSTGFLPYHEAIHVFLKTMNVIDEMGVTNDRCGVKTSIIMNERSLGISTGMDKLNRLKYLIGLDEKQIFEWWPQADTESKLVYQGQVSHIKIKKAYDTLMSTSLLERLDPHHLALVESDFFGNDFSKINEKILSINYIGGKNYTKKKREAVDTINLVIGRIYETLKNGGNYSDSEKRKIEDITESMKSALSKTRTFTSFKSAYPDAVISINLKKDEQTNESEYVHLREKLFEFALAGGIEEAFFNWDSVRKKFQVKGAKFKNNLMVEGAEFFDCTLEGELKNCLVDSSIIRNSKLTECAINTNNMIKFSKLFDCEYLGGANEISLSFLENSENKPILADLRECLIYKGTLSLQATVDSSTKIVE
jgi:hypothetical protein